MVDLLSSCYLIMPTCACSPQRDDGHFRYSSDHQDLL